MAIKDIEIIYRSKINNKIALLKKNGYQYIVTDTYYEPDMTWDNCYYFSANSGYDDSTAFARALDRFRMLELKVIPKDSYAHLYMPHERMIQIITQLLDEMNRLNHNETLNIIKNKLNLNHYEKHTLGIKF